MNKAELVGEIAARTKQPATEVSAVVDELVRVVTTAVARGDKVVLSGFGTFHRKARAKRVARNIWADEPLPLPAANVPAFRPGKSFREVVARRRRRAPVPGGRGARPGGFA